MIDMVASGAALCVAGNHESRLLRKLNGRDVNTTHGLAQSLEQIDALPAAERVAFVAAARGFLDGLRSHYWLDDGKLVVAHAGLREEMHGRGSAAVRSFALYGETTGETDEFGLPVRFNWAAQYRGKATVVYGHVPTPTAEWVNRTICIDTGCVFGGRLTALRYPELELVDVPAARVYCEPIRPLAPAAAAETAQQNADALLDIEDISGKRRIATALLGRVRVGSDHAAAAIEVVGRSAVDPRWLVYLPPTMSPAETSRRPELLEHPEDAFAYFTRSGVGIVIVQEKHMGSRAVIAIARDEAAARHRFAPGDRRIGRIWTRTGRPFFAEDAIEQALLDRLAAALSASRFWDRLDTDWACFDAELMPWSAKAQPLIADQYEPVGIAGCAATNAAAALATVAAARGIEVAELHDRLRLRAANAEAFASAYRHFVGNVAGIDGLRLALFHVLATEGAVHADRPHPWHLAAANEIGAADPELFVATDHRVVDLGDETAREAAIAWWDDLTEKGGEGVVVKPLDFVARGPGGLVQPALKCRGREYLRIVYGPDYTMPEHLARLRQRALGRKRALALQEFALGIEALQRFVRREPLRRVHECVFAILALESEPVDARL